MNPFSFLNIGRRLCMAFIVVLMPVFSQASENGVSDKEIIIGQSIALQDGKNIYGVAAAQGAKLYFDMVNAGGGLHGRKIVLRVLDDDNKQPTPKLTPANSLPTAPSSCSAPLKAGHRMLS